MPPAIELNFPNPIEQRADLFDREDELELIQATLRASARRPIVILGERVMGKTSLLNVVVEAARGEPQISVLQLPHVDSRKGFAEEILEGIAGEIGTSLYRRGFRDDHGEFRLSTTAEFVRVAGELSGDKGGGCFLLCLEELDSMLVKCSDAAANQILDFLLQLISNPGLPIKFIFTMTRTTPQILRSDASPFLSAARITHLEPWAFEEACDFVTWLLRGVRTLQREAHEQLYAGCGGHPYLTKAVLQMLQESPPGSAAGGSVRPAQLQAAVKAAIASPMLDFTLDNIVNVHFSAEELQVLGEVASRGGSIDQARLRALGDPYPAAAHELHRRRYLRPDRDGGYVQAFGVLGEWMQGKPWTVRRPPAQEASPPGAPAGPSRDPPELVIDEVRNRVFVGTREVILSPQEHQFLRCLAGAAGSVVDRHTVATEVWPDDVLVEGVRESRLDALVSRLRRALGDDATRYLETRRGWGFYLDPDLVRVRRKE